MNVQFLDYTMRDIVKSLQTDSYSYCIPDLHGRSFIYVDLQVCAIIALGI